MSSVRRDVLPSRVFQLWWTSFRTLWAAVAGFCCSTRRRRSAAPRRRNGPSSRRVCTGPSWRTPWASFCWSWRRSVSPTGCLPLCASSRRNRELCKPGKEGRGGWAGTGSRRTAWPLWSLRHASGGRCATICLSGAKPKREIGLVSERSSSGSAVLHEAMQSTIWTSVTGHFFSSLSSLVRKYKQPKPVSSDINLFSSFFIFIFLSSLARTGLTINICLSLFYGGKWFWFWLLEASRSSDNEPQRSDLRSVFSGL